MENKREVEREREGGRERERERERKRERDKEKRREREREIERVSEHFNAILFTYLHHIHFNLQIILDIIHTYRVATLL